MNVIIIYELAYETCSIGLSFLSGEYKIYSVDFLTKDRFYSVVGPIFIHKVGSFSSRI